MVLPCDYRRALFALVIFPDCKGFFTGAMIVILFYCGLNEQQWNHHPVAPGPLACVAPVYGKSVSTKQVNRVKVPTGCAVIQDSGAFSDSHGQRLCFEAALERQLEHAEKYGYASAVTHRASYDLLIDEVWREGMRQKERWSESDADPAVEITVAAATYLAKHREGKGLILSAQGVTAQQYLTCIKRIVPLLSHGDIVGLGGFCVTGKKPAMMMPVFRETMRLCIPFLGHEGVSRVHLWGVCYAPALGELLWLCDEHNITFSTDSSGPCRLPVYGQWGYAEWRDLSYVRPPVETRGLERARHVQATRAWFDRFRSTPHYQPPPLLQLPLWFS